MLRMRVCGCVIALLCSCFVLLAVAQVTNPSEVNALRAVKSSLSDPRKHLKNWNNGDPCKSHWNGVFCNNTVGADGYLHLEELRLLNMNLSGSLAPELGQLSHLLILDFMWNELSGTIPKEIGNITSLKLLLLSGNKLSGSLPDELGYLSKLDRLQVDQNYMSGPIPKSFVNLVNVKHLHMNNNSFSGQIPSELSKVPTLLHLLFDSNNLSGYLPPEFSNLPNLRIIQFDNNNFRGTEIPASYGNISKLVKISLRNCSLQGEIPDFSRIRSLHYLSLENNWLTGSVPAILWNISSSTRARLALDLRNNSLSNILGELNPPANVTLRFLVLNFILHHGNFTYIVVIVIVEPRRMGIRKEILAAIITGAVASSVILSTTVMLLITRCLRHRDRPPSRRHSSSKITVKIDGVKAFTFKEMTLATRNFDSSTQLGRGGYGKVYRGILSDDTVVAIKRAEQGSLQGEKEFLTEIELLSRLHHRNLVSLVGYCDEEGEQMLVYEFMPNGTLRDWLCVKAKGSLSFGMRLQIALGSAKGILYLHNEANPPIFHRDIKTTNILLDSNLMAKVADFGLSRLAPLQDDEGAGPSYVSTVVRGTPVNLAHQAGLMFSIIDSRMGSYPSECVERFLALALRCCYEKQDKRPAMLEVVRELENIIKIMPTADTIFSPSAASNSDQSPTSSSYLTRDTSYMSSSVVGSDLSSGVVPTIVPR
ncbi:hypothetical protein ACE6H2_021945 [Prunus campanulata]